MARGTLFWIVLVLGLGLFAFVAYIAARHTHSTSDYFIASRRLNGWIGALAHVGAGLSVWILLILSGAAFFLGLSAVWLALGLLLGTAINTWFVARRLRAVGALHGALTIGELLSLDVGDRMLPHTARSIVAITVCSLLLQAATMLQFVAAYVETDLGLNGASVVVAGIVAVTACALIGGLRALATCDLLQTLALLAVGGAVATGGVLSQGGWGDFWAAFHLVAEQGGDWFAGTQGVIAVAVSGGGLGFGLSLLGQPVALTRFLALRDERTLFEVTWLTVLWSAALLAAMLMCGWVARVLYAGVQQPELALFTLVVRPLPPGLGTAIVAIVVCVIFAAAMSALFTAASACAVELRTTRQALSTAWGRVLLVLFAVAVVLVALLVRLSVTEHMLLAFSAVGAALGPVLLVRLAGKRIRPATQLGAIWAGFLLTLVFHLLPDGPGDFLERVLPFVAALGIALTGGERRRNPDRADRSQQAVHDRVPI